jgi:hypothetical protein
LIGNLAELSLGPFTELFLAQHMPKV